MSLDKERISVADALQIAEEYYPKNKFNHAIRVMMNIANNSLIEAEYRDDCIILAIMHDLIEDTKYTGDKMSDNMYKALKLLTKPQDVLYVDYIKNIKTAATHTKWGLCAWWVKIADIKDHLTQTDTLTEALKEKYLSALPYLL